MKTDRRSQKTIAAIQNTVLRLMCTRRMNEIKIVDLCVEADINRTTFYLHFRNIAEVLESLVNEMAAKIFADGAYEVNVSSQPVVDFLTACADTLDGYEYFGAFMQKSEDADIFLTRLKNVLAEKISSHIVQRSGMQEGSTKPAVRFLTGGVLDVYTEWLKSDKSIDLGTVLGACAPMVEAGINLLENETGE